MVPLGGVDEMYLHRREGLQVVGRVDQGVRDGLYHLGVRSGASSHEPRGNNLHLQNHFCLLVVGA